MDSFRSLMAETGYELRTTFWEDFSIADIWGISAVQDTFNRAFKEWKHNYVFLTEMVLVLNHKIWQHYKSKPALAKLYDTLWREADQYAMDNLSENEMQYYFRVTD